MKSRIALVLVFVLASGADLRAQDPHEAAVAFRPFAGGSVIGDGRDIRGLMAGAEVTIAGRQILWTPIEVSAAFPTDGGYIRLAAGAALRLGGGSYLGTLVGMSRFTPDPSFVAARFGSPLPFARQLVAELRLEHHARELRGGTAVAFSLRLPLGVN